MLFDPLTCEWAMRTTRILPPLLSLSHSSEGSPFKVSLQLSRNNLTVSASVLQSCLEIQGLLPDITKRGLSLALELGSCDLRAVRAAAGLIAWRNGRLPRRLSSCC